MDMYVDFWGCFWCLCRRCIKYLHYLRLVCYFWTLEQLAKLRASLRFEDPSVCILTFRVNKMNRMSFEICNDSYPILLCFSFMSLIWERVFLAADGFVCAVFGLEYWHTTLLDYCTQYTVLFLKCRPNFMMNALNNCPFELHVSGGQLRCWRNTIVAQFI